MIGHVGGGGGRALSKCSNTIYYKNLFELIWYKPVGKYQRTIACLRALVMIAYQVINCLISKSKHKLWVIKRTKLNVKFN